MNKFQRAILMHMTVTITLVLLEVETQAITDGGELAQIPILVIYNNIH